MSFPFRKLALGGGGAKGILQIGALRELSKHQPLYFPDGVYGCSIGAIIAVLVSFQIPMDNDFLSKTKDFISIEKFVPKLSFENIQYGFSGKGIFTMDVFQTELVKIFKIFDLDIEKLKIGDAKMPLNIIASNLTKGIPTIFRGNVPIIDALKCSCCLPVVYRPQELYGQIYIDGEAFLPYLGSVVKDGLIISLKSNHFTKITPENLEKIGLLQYIRHVYLLGTINVIKLHKTNLTLQITYPNLSPESDLNTFDINDIMKVSENSMRRFLIANGFLQKISKVGDIRGT